MTAAHAKQYRQRHRKAGLCRECPQRVKAGHIRCARHLEQLRQWALRYRLDCRRALVMIGGRSAMPPPVKKSTRQICPQCQQVFHEAGWRSASKKIGPFCTRDCAGLAQLAAQPPAVFTRGVPSGTQVCPRPGCGGMLAREGCFLHCPWGGRWPIRGASLDEALAYERSAGIRVGAA